MELVAPAGNLDKLRYAYAYGADAAYIGLKHFSLRLKADNFHTQEHRAVHELKACYPDKKLFCALNVSFHNRDIDLFLNEIEYFKAFPFDAFIVQDMGMVHILQKHFPNTALHLSTQANCINREAVKLYKELGFSRIVLGREASLAEIAEIKQAVPDMELEVFVHGAMCIAYSGRCLMSAYMNGRSANAGFCSHSCRWNYKLLAQSGNLVLEEKERPGSYLPVFEGDNCTAVLSSKDLCMIEHLDDLKKAGADSLKIEGRMKSLYYTAVVTRAYRKAVDLAENRISKKDAQPFIKELYKTSHREFASGFFYNAKNADKTTCGETSGKYEMTGTIGQALTAEKTQSVFARAKEVQSAFLQSLKKLHPKARAAKEADLQKHPEKQLRTVKMRKNRFFYEYQPLNFTDSQTALEAVGPDTVCIKLSASSYEFVNPETGELLRSVSHNTPCLLYTAHALQSDWIIRQKAR